MNHYKKDTISKEELADFIVKLILDTKELIMSNNSKIDGRTVKTEKNKLKGVALNFISQGFSKDQTNLKEFLKYKLDFISLIYFVEVSCFYLKVSL